MKCVLCTYFGQTISYVLWGIEKFRKCGLFLPRKLCHGVEFVETGVRAYSIYSYVCLCISHLISQDLSFPYW